MLVSVELARSVSCNREGDGVGQTTGCWVAQRPNAEGLHPVVLSVSTVRSHSVTGCWQGLVKHDRTCPVGKNQFWNLTINDRTLGVQRPITYGRAFGHVITVEIRQLLLNTGWHVAAIGLPDAEPCVRSVGPERPVTPISTQ